MHCYWVEYRMVGNDVRGIDVVAKNKVDAYDKAFFESIPAKEGSCPYSAWVRSVTYNNGGYHLFNTSEGNPY